MAAGLPGPPRPEDTETRLVVLEDRPLPPPSDAAPVAPFRLRRDAAEPLGPGPAVMVTRQEGTDVCRPRVPSLVSLVRPLLPPAPRGAAACLASLGPDGPSAFFAVVGLRPVAAAFSGVTVETPPPRVAAGRQRDRPDGPAWGVDLLAPAVGQPGPDTASRPRLRPHVPARGVVPSGPTEVSSLAAAGGATAAVKTAPDFYPSFFLAASPELNEQKLRPRRRAP